MTTFTGWDGLAARRSGRLSGVSADLVSGTAPAVIYAGVRPGLRVQAGIDADGRWQHVPVFVGWPAPGSIAWRNNLWDKIITQPPTLEAGFVLSDLDFTVEVWSTFRDSAKHLTGLATTGAGNLALTDPFGCPLVYQPGQSRLYPARLPGAGDLAIDARTDFTFSDAPGAVFTVAGTRITVFSHRPDWSEPWRETISHLTEILPAYDGTEQRRPLRTRPRFACAFRVLTTTPTETMALDNLVYGWQARQYGVPWWPETTLLAAPVSTGSKSLPCVTEYRPSFEVGGMVLVWASFDLWEAFRVESVTASSIEIAAPLTRSWPTGTRLVPLRRGRLGGEQSLGRPLNWLTADTFAFTCEAV